VSNITLVKMIIRSTGASEDLIEFVTDRLGHDLRYAIDTTDINSRGWHAYVRLPTGIERTIEWYKSNGDWCDGLNSN